MVGAKRVPLDHSTASRTSLAVRLWCGMYAIAILRYRRPLDEVLAVLDPHRAYLRSLKEQGLLIASGPMDPRNGGVLLLDVPDESAHATLDRIRDEDPFTHLGMAQYELIPWLPSIGKDDLDRLTGKETTA